MDNNQKEKKSQKENFAKLSQGEKSKYLIKTSNFSCSIYKLSF